MGGWLLRLLGMTWRVRVHGSEWLVARAADAPRVVYTLWHGQLLPITYAHPVRTSAIVSEHRDGEIIANVLAQLGFGAIRGSSSRGGARALLESVAVLRGGEDVAFTPDGPRGPRHSFAPGALALAFRAGASVVPIVAHVNRAWRLRSWDAFEIPKPFARVTIVYGAPMPVIAADVRAAAAATPAFEAAMHATAARVRALAGAAAPSP